MDAWNSSSFWGKMPIFRECNTKLFSGDCNRNPCKMTETFGFRNYSKLPRYNTKLVFIKKKGGTISPKTTQVEPNRISGGPSRAPSLRLSARRDQDPGTWTGEDGDFGVGDLFLGIPPGSLT